MKRFLPQVIGVVLLACLAVVGCGNGDDAASRDSSAAGSPHRSGVPTGEIPRPEPLLPGEGAFDQCQPGKSGGGYDVWIKDISCSETRLWLTRLAPTFNLSKSTGLGRLENGWECLTQRSPNLTYHYSCARGNQVIVFSASF